MAKTLIILVLLFDGTLVQEKYELTREMSVSECLQYGDDHREAIAEYKEFKDNLKNGWYLKDGRGTIQGHMCEQSSTLACYTFTLELESRNTYSKEGKTRVG